LEEEAVEVIGMEVVEAVVVYCQEVGVQLQQPIQ
jgi:hypothetical protein